ncbi:MAG: hypothetical protein PF961_09745 [Planctomycetota bacterium]|jgi:hypothetical protein|nr:hypothetical protein [Planctomycetota bacterium]
MSDAINVIPTLRPRLEFLATGLAMLVMAAGCTWIALTRGDQLLHPAEHGIDLGGLEPIRHILVGLIWLVVGLCAVTGLWSLWAVGAAARCLRIDIDQGLFMWRPYIGLRVRFELERMVSLEDMPARFLRPAHLAVRWGRRRKPLKLYRKWYLPMDYKRIRAALQDAIPEAQPDGAGD